MPLDELRKRHYLFVAGGVGTAPVYPQVKWLKEHGVKADVIIGAKTRDMLIYTDAMRAVAENLHIATDDGSEGFKGLVTQVIDELIGKQGRHYDECVAIGPMIMMKFVALTTKKYALKTTVSLNALMVDGTGMCGACRVTVAGRTRFTCVEGPEFDGHEVDFDEAMRRQGMYRTQAQRAAAHRTAPRNGRRVAVIGSGPAGLACASDLAKMGYGVKIFEALHKVGGVLVYGIPEFRLPKQRIVAREIAEVERLGVEIETDVIVGRTVTVDSLLGEEGYDAVFIGSGAGLPRFMGIPGENLNGVVSANEFLTRANLMRAYDDTYDTPIYVGKRVVVVGGGNVAMDAVRTAKRLGAEATIVYRRSEKELPARVEEVHHAKQEGICFRMLTNPAEVLGDERGWVTGIRCVEMELGEPDQSGRRSPVVKPGSEFDIACDVVIMALGTSPNPLLAATTAGLETDRRGCITADGQGATSREGVFAGGDAVTGAATVILAMGAGRTAARAIDEYLRKR